MSRPNQINQSKWNQIESNQTHSNKPNKILLFYAYLKKKPNKQNRTKPIKRLNLLFTIFTNPITDREDLDQIPIGCT
jgi:hypothetical protein